MIFTLISHRRAALATALIACLWLLLPACATPRATEPLETSVRLYNDSVRWQRFDDAAERLPAPERDGFLDRRDQLADDLEIHHYEVIRVRHDKTGMRAKVHVKYTWYLESSGVVRETHTVQQWHKGAEVWLMVSESLLRGDEMPGVDDAEEPEEAAGAGEGASEDSGEGGDFEGVDGVEEDTGYDDDDAPSWGEEG